MIKIVSDKEATMETRLLLTDQLQRKLTECVLEEEKSHCMFCLDIVKNGYMEHFSEVYQFLGIEEEIVPSLETESVRRVLNMYQDIHMRMETMTIYERTQLREYLFNGFMESTQHGYYVFLCQHGYSEVPCDCYRPKRLETYLEFVDAYEALGNDNSHSSLISIFNREKEVLRPLHA